MTDTHDTLAADVQAQLETLTLQSDRPLIVTDGDEVIFAFLEALEAFLGDNDMFIRLDSFALTGNIRRNKDGVAVEAHDVRDWIGAFFAERTETIPLIPGTKDAVDRLSPHCDFIMLTNIPPAQREARAKALENNGLSFPVIANSGRKGPALSWISERVSAPVFFLDDIPHNIESAAVLAPKVRSIHFIGDARLAALIGRSKSAETRIDDWPTVCDYILTQLTL